MSFWSRCRTLPASSSPIACGTPRSTTLCTLWKLLMKYPVRICQKSDHILEPCNTTTTPIAPCIYRPAVFLGVYTTEISQNFINEGAPAILYWQRVAYNVNIQNNDRHLVGTKLDSRCSVICVLHNNRFTAVFSLNYWVKVTRYGGLYELENLSCVQVSLAIRTEYLQASMWTIRRNALMAPPLIQGIRSNESDCVAGAPKKVTHKEFS